jgi:hypothetical protein
MLPSLVRLRTIETDVSQLLVVVLVTRRVLVAGAGLGRGHKYGSPRRLQHVLGPGQKSHIKMRVSPRPVRGLLRAARQKTGSCVRHRETARSRPRGRGALQDALLNTAWRTRHAFRMSSRRANAAGLSADGFAASSGFRRGQAAYRVLGSRALSRVACVGRGRARPDPRRLRGGPRSVRRPSGGGFSSAPRQRLNGTARPRQDHDPLPPHPGEHMHLHVST